MVLLPTLKPAMQAETKKALTPQAAEAMAQEAVDAANAVARAAADSGNMTAAATTRVSS